MIADTHRSISGNASKNETSNVFKFIVASLAAAFALSMSDRASAHHSASVYYDTSTIIAVRDVLTDVRWHNPHIAFTLLSREDGAEVEWLVESNSVSSLRHLGVTEDQLTPGALVTVAGWASRREPYRMSGNNVLLPGNREIVLWGSSAYHFSDESYERLSVADVEARNLPDASGLGLFRIWSTLTGDSNQDRLWASDYPLTADAISAQQNWDPFLDNPAIRCEPKGMPGIIDPPYPMEFVDQDDIILIRQEEFDTVRTVYMNPGSAENDPDPGILGHSTGSWEGDTLVIETTHISWPYLDNRGLPLSQEARLQERYTVSPDGRRLYLDMTVTDPQFLSEPIELDRFWLWIPENTVQPYNCTPL
ncbi:MAG: DUF6152 family protein [Gammaproteobacteria bacterium]